MIGSSPIVQGTSQHSTAACAYCAKKLLPEQVKKCSKCMSAIYCQPECQRNDWSKHKTRCIPSQQTSHVDKNRSQSAEEVNKTRRLTALANLRAPPELPFLSLRELAQEDNELIRMSFNNFVTHIDSKKGKLPLGTCHLATPVFNHPLKTREFILEGCKHLDPQKSVVLVCGAQYYDGNYVEPLPELLAKCKRLILVDVDQSTLDQLKERLNSQKITIISQDLSCTNERLESFRREVEQHQYRHDEFYRHAARFVTELIADIEAMPPGIAGILAEGESADYVVSSLVASQLPAKINKYLFRVISACYKYDMEEFSGHAQIKDLEELLSQLNRVMVKKHLSDLFACAGQHGGVYFADTFKLNNTLVIHPDVQEDLRKTFSQRVHGKTGNWHWMEDLKRIYTVGAFLGYAKE